LIDKKSASSSSEIDTSDPETHVDDAEVVEETTLDDERPDPDKIETGDTVDQQQIGEEAPESSSVSSDVSASPQAPRSAFWPMVFGGALAAAIGFGAAIAFEPQSGWFGGDEALRQEIEAIEAQTDGFSARMTNMEGAFEASAKSEDVEVLSNDLDAYIQRFEPWLNDLEQRLTTLEERPLVEVAGSDEIAAAYEAELADLRAALDAQRAEMLAIASDASAKLEEAAAKAAEVENSAASAANAASIRSALSRIQVALETGNTYAVPMQEIEATSDTVAPDILVLHSEDGVATLASLQQSFPDAARATLALARQQTADDPGLGGRLWTFFESQTGARSVTPRAGDDPDAILSRAEAALKDGRITDALAELDALPQSANAPLSDWRSLAETRLTVLSALQDWADSLSTN
jgi:hypothetical protein